MTDQEIYSQFFSQITKAKNVLIALPQSPGVDLAGAATAMFLFLSKLEKTVQILATENYEERYLFLPETGKIKSSLTNGQSLVVVIDTRNKALEEISYEQAKDQAKIFLKGKTEVLSPEDIKFEVTNQTVFDLVIILGAASLQDLGQIFEQNADVFYNTPKINIDISPANRHFGAINLVDINASSVSEAVAVLLGGFEIDLVDEHMATCLLAGIIAKTRSFQHPQVTPRVFLQASIMVAKGAKQQEIVKALFKTKSLSVLKLWGRSLARLQDFGSWALAVLSPQDFDKAQAVLADLPLVFKELTESQENKLLVLLLGRQNSGAKLWACLKSGLEIGALTESFGPARLHKGLVFAPQEAWEFDLDKDLKLEDAESKLKNISAKVLQLI